MKKYWFLIVCFSLFFFPITIQAENKINHIQMDVNLLKDGSALVHETWNVSLDSGTELYRSYGDTNLYPITDFVVTDDLNHTYTFIENWHSNLSLNEKQYKNGFIQENNEIELCWGMSDYSITTYHLQYKIHNLVQAYQDSMGIDFTFLPENMTTSLKNMQVFIHSDIFNFKEETSKIWAIGFDGNISFNKNGVLVSSTNLTPNSYMGVLIQMKNATFTNPHIVNKKFQDVYNTVTQTKTGYTTTGIQYFLLFFIIILIIPVLTLILHSFPRKSQYKQDQKLRKVSLSENTSIPYYREIPLQKDLIKIFYIANKYDLIENESNIIGAFLLKWMKEKRISIEIDENNKKNFKIKFLRLGKFNQPLEEDLQNLFLCAEVNKVIDLSYFKDICKDRYQQIISWFYNLNFEGSELLEHDGLLKRETFKETFDGKTVTRTLITLTEQAEEVGQQLLGLKKFMLEFGTIKEKTWKDAIVWEDYLMIAHLLGISDTVCKNLKTIEPSFLYLKQMNLNTVMDFSKTFELALYKTAHDIYRQNHTNLSSNNDHSFSSSVSSGAGRKSFTTGTRSSGGFSSRGGGFR